MNLVRALLVGLLVTAVGIAAAVGVGSAIDSLALGDALDTLVVALPLVLAAFAAGALAARSYGETGRGESTRRLLAAISGPALVGLAGAAAVQRGVSGEGLLRLANLAVTVGPAAAGAVIQGRRDR